ncbi:unnamed protein product [Diatraea saccharalis]|uniref:BEN domain-containing protein n=1 Tax=Diatraea saccharalis TaxID=40085 RepID=A0A9N9R9R5_9NEOP|nr:unnamed protein product [Diatraea saccharalis]
MMEYNGSNKKNFYVVRFIEIPFEGIDDYVCVPNSWVVIRRVTDKKVVIAYPNNEDPFDTRDRVKRKEKFDEEWRFYMAVVKYETDNYKDAEYWIASKNNYGSLMDKYFEIECEHQDSQSPKFMSRLRSESRKSPLKSNTDKPRMKVKSTENSRKSLRKIILKKTVEKKPTEQLYEKLLKLDNTSQTSRSADQTEATVASSSNKPASSQLTSEKRHRSSPVPQAKKKMPSLPIIDVDTATEVISIDKEDELQERQQSEANTDNQSQHVNNPSAASMAPPQPPTSIQQSPHSDHHDHRRHSQEGKNSHIKPEIREVQYVVESDTNETPRNVRILNSEPNTSDHLPKFLKMSAQLYDQGNERPSMIPMHEPVEKRTRLANCERLMAIVAQNPSNLMDQRRSSPPERQEPSVTQNSSLNIPDFRIKIERSSNMNALDPKVVLERIDNVASAVRYTPSLPHQRPSFVRRVNKRRYSPPLEQCQQQPMDIPETLQRPRRSHSITQRTDLEELSMRKASSVQRLPNPEANQPNEGAPQSYQSNPGTFHQEQNQDLRRVFIERINPTQPTSSGIEINIPACYLISTNVPIQKVPSSNFSLQRQPPQYHPDAQQQSRPSELQIGIPTHASSHKRLPIVQDVSQRSSQHIQSSIPDSIRQSSTITYPNYIRDLQRLETRVQGKPIDRNPGSEISSQNIIPPAAAGEFRSLEGPSYSSQQFRRELLKSGSDNLHQPFLPYQRMPYQLPDMAMKRVISESNIANSSTVRSPPRSEDHVRHTDKCMKVDPVFPGQSSFPHPKVAVDHEVLTEQETFTSNADCAGASGKQDSASSNKQLHARIVLEQQMLDQFSTIMTQVGSNLYYTCEMYKNLQSSILETADTYKKLLNLAERFNALETVKGAASFSSTVAPKLLSLKEEKKSRAPKRASSINHNPHSSRIDEELLNKKRTMQWKVVLPAEYDPNDTEWTLKCKKIVPGLKELLPEKGIYVNCAKLMHAERVSGDCKTLASLVLEEVFSKIALTVCSTWYENNFPNECWIERPPLDLAAWYILFNYVLRFGRQHGWKIDTEEIIKAMDNKIYEIRIKNDILTEPCML